MQFYLLSQWMNQMKASCSTFLSVYYAVSVSIQMKAIKQYFSTICRMKRIVITVYYALQLVLNFQSLDENL